jgi:hypothetical protein
VGSERRRRMCNSVHENWREPKCRDGRGWKWCKAKDDNLTPYYGRAKGYIHDVEGWITWDEKLNWLAFGRYPVGFCIFPSKVEALRMQVFAPEARLLHVEYEDAIAIQYEPNAMDEQVLEIILVRRWRLIEDQTRSTS